MIFIVIIGIIIISFVISGAKATVDLSKISENGDLPESNNTISTILTELAIKVLKICGYIIGFIFIVFIIIYSFVLPDKMKKEIKNDLLVTGFEFRLWMSDAKRPSPGYDFGKEINKFCSGYVNKNTCENVFANFADNNEIGKEMIYNYCKKGENKDKEYCNEFKIYMIAGDLQIKSKEIKANIEKWTSKNNLDWTIGVEPMGGKWTSTSLYLKIGCPRDYTCSGGIYESVFNKEYLSKNQNASQMSVGYDNKATLIISKDILDDPNKITEILDLIVTTKEKVITDYNEKVQAEENQYKLNNIKKINKVDTKYHENTDFVMNAAKLENVDYETKFGYTEDKGTVDYSKEIISVGSPWGKIFNPMGNCPVNKFRAYYIDRSTLKLIKTEEVKRPVIRFFDPLEGVLVPKNFGGYWVGVFNFSKDTNMRFSVSQQQSETRIYVDGKILSGGEIEYLFTKGPHKVEIEHQTDGHTVGFMTRFNLAEKLENSASIKDELSKTVVKSAKTIFAGVYESGDKYGNIDLKIEENNIPVVVVLGSMEGTTWRIITKDPNNIKAIIVNTQIGRSNVIGNIGGVKVLQMENPFFRGYEADSDMQLRNTSLLELGLEFGESTYMYSADTMLAPALSLK